MGWRERIRDYLAVAGRPVEVEEVRKAVTSVLGFRPERFPLWAVYQDLEYLVENEEFEVVMDGETRKYYLSSDLVGKDNYSK
jgi:hypothetical protein